MDPTTDQLTDLNRHAGASRWAFNHALGSKVAANRQWCAAVDALIADGMPKASPQGREGPGTGQPCVRPGRAEADRAAPSPRCRGGGPTRAHRG
ncbi:helix-turn-helix domain-containing protein [Kitasatospora sp. NPDC051984]|uniref:helix-turn-helix domain-containing protein n=1 Tax=Kitasatospora sp. NPDC051984 TaxID=3364059 RepID=UPI0037CBEE3E